ncbi:S41 family peptidase [Flavisolibacter ginsenosidimutans]|uniref:Tricorn protease homolog n=1 Tax=Flavisolibacter ginsenosidimutans TaxID=661481 RepID=A0A5B8UMN4_9BACT|nr:S41 family peptidase [Flavisolibacter ginsenosidimutans]QEC57459.1 peptidase S41 [Flavisolibacter ginsenosidimutans]
MKRRLLFAAALLLSASGFAQNNALWIRYPAISPDGKTIVFSYKGDLYKVPSSGGEAVPLTVHEAYDFMPVWSKDGKWLAFASDRFGNFDVFVMPATGGDAKRLTFNSAADYPYDFTPDGKSVLFGTTRNDVYTSARFPQRSLFQKLYKVPVTGGRSVMFNSAGAEFAHYNSKGDKIIFQDRKGYEDAARKHHTSAVTRDIWMYDIKKDEYVQISNYEGEDREPVWGGDDNTVYYLSEKDGSQNIYKAVVGGNASVTQVSKMKTHPVRHLSRSADGTLCFTYDGELYTMKDGGAPQKISVIVNTDTRGRDEKILPVNTGVTQTALSPNGKEIAFVVRGEVFVTSVEGGITKRITNTPQQERTVEFSPDGRTLYYASERGNSWDIYKATIERKEEPYFYTSTVVKEEPVIATEADEFQPEVSPDGKEIAYLEERNVLKVYNLASKKSRTIVPKGVNFSYADGDQYYQWSPDGKWITFNSAEGRWGSSEVAMMKADGSGERKNLTQSGFFDGQPKWAFGGKALLWTTDRDGKKPLAFQGAREVDVYAMFFDQEAYDKFKLTKDEFALAKEREDKEKEEAKKDTSNKIAPPKKGWEPNLEGLDNRKLRLTINSGNISDYMLSNDGEKLYFIARMEKGYDLWMTNPRTKETKLIAKMDGGPGGMDVSKDGKSLFVVSDGKIVKVDAESGRIAPVVVNGEMVLRADKEREYIFDHAFRQVAKKFYDPKIHGIDWAGFHSEYAKFLPHINNNYDFQELLSEFLGELNASHTGGRYSPAAAGGPQTGDATASLGLLYDETYDGNGVKVMEVIENGPFTNAKTKIKKGVVIEKINGEEIVENMDWSRMLNRQTGKNVLLSLYDPETKQRWDETTKPISQGEEQALLYQRWVNNNRKKVEELSGGKVGYIHIQGMNDNSYRTVYEEALGKAAGKEALIVDTRFNGGGWLHDDLVTFLSGKKYLDFSPQGAIATSGEPRNKWTAPSTVLMSESNYSDAFIFPYAYHQLGIGKLIGMPVAGTGTAVWWETQIDPTIVFGIPMIATIGKEGRPTENLQLEPDIKVQNDYKSVLSGKDPQLERAVKEMLEEIKKGKKI